MTGNLPHFWTLYGLNDRAIEEGTFIARAFHALMYVHFGLRGKDQATGGDLTDEQINACMDYARKQLMDAFEKYVESIRKPKG